MNPERDFLIAAPKRSVLGQIALFFRGGVGAYAKRPPSCSIAPIGHEPGHPSIRFAEETGWRLEAAMADGCSRPGWQYDQGPWPWRPPLPISLRIIPRRRKGSRGTIACEAGRSWTHGGFFGYAQGISPSRRYLRESLIPRHRGPSAPAAHSQLHWREGCLGPAGNPTDMKSH